MVSITDEDRVWHRHYVGALWDQIGRLQFEFLRSEGLRPGHSLIDVACGSLRGGVHLIPYLRRGHYLGLDKRGDLIAAGLRHELPRRVRWRKTPRFVVSDRFEFDKFGRTADVGIAQSLFTHLTPPLIVSCLANLRAWSPGCRLYATFFEGDSASNPPEPHDNKRFRYSREEMAGFAGEAGWAMRYIGEWGHPRGQVMTELRGRQAGRPKPSADGVRKYATPPDRL